jgi:thiamine pyrophosphate-dependent acetolactate synthase large subunit-like protein
MQNGGYAASSRPVHELFPDPDRPQPPATAFDIEFDVGAVAAACGATGVTVSSSSGLVEAVADAVAAWRRGELVVIGARVTSPWIV